MTKQQINYKQTEIGGIARDWGCLQLGQLIELKYGKALQETKRQEGEIPVYGSVGIVGYHNQAIVEGPCIIVGRKGNPGAVSYSSSDCWPIDTTYYVEKSSKYDLKYLYYKLITLNLKSLDSSSAVPGLNRNDAYGFDIAIPPLTEQQQIASILSSLDDKIELNRRMNKTLEEIGKALFRHWFVDFEFPNEEGRPYKSSGGEMVDSELGMIPRGWEVRPLDEIADFLNGLACQKYPPVNEGKSLPIIKIAELRRGFTDSSDRATSQVGEEYIVNNGDVLFSWSGSLEVCLWPYQTGILNQHLFKVTSKDFPKWFYYFWILQHLSEFRTIASGKATTMGHIQRKHLKNSFVLIPDKATLNKMDTVMQPILDSQIINNSQISSLENIRDNLLPRLMSGRLRV